MTMTGNVTCRSPFVNIILLTHLWMILVSVEGWTYHFVDQTMNWDESREWCQKNYTDIAMVHNENVTHLLKDHFPKKSSAPYYWIGMKKINSNWTWVANNQIASYQNWDKNEPNNDLSNENCVEVYIRQDLNDGKWNDEDCKKKKYPLCHKAQCLNNSCSDRSVCKEQVNNFTCECKPGFSGPQCETVESCKKLSIPRHGWIECSGQYGNHSLGSNCKFSCAAGYKLIGTAELKCSSSGAWSAPQPSCTGYVHFLFALLPSVVISVICGCLLCCSHCSRRKTAVRARTQQEMMNPAYEIEHPPLEGPLCSV